MLQRLAQLALGSSWQTSVAALAAALTYVAASVPAIANGTATAADYRHAAVAFALFLIGRLAKDGGKP